MAAEHGGLYFMFLGTPSPNFAIQLYYYWQLNWTDNVQLKYVRIMVKGN